MNAAIHHVRPLTRDDIPQCKAICEQAFEEGGYTYDVVAEIERSLGEPYFNQPYYYVYDDGHVKGVAAFANSGWDDSVYGVFSCYISKEYRGIGIGKELTSFRLQKILQLGGQIVFATTKETWHLERFGFKVIDSPYGDWKLMQLNIVVSAHDVDNLF